MDVWSNSRRRAVLQDAWGRAHRLAENGATVPDGCRDSCWCELRHRPQPVRPIVSLGLCSNLSPGHGHVCWGETSQLTRQVWRPSGTQTGAIGPSAHNLFAWLVCKREAETQKRAKWTVCSLLWKTILESVVLGLGRGLYVLMYFMWRGLYAQCTWTCLKFLGDSGNPKQNMRGKKC